MSYLICFSTLIIAITNYNLNKPLFNGLILLLLFLFWITGFYEKIKVTNDYILFENAHLIPFFNRGKKYIYSEIDSIELEGKTKKKDFMKYQYLSVILPGFFLINNIIKVNLKTNNLSTHLSEISQEEFTAIFHLLNQKANDRFTVKLSI